LQTWQTYSSCLPALPALPRRRLLPLKQVLMSALWHQGWVHQLNSALVLAESICVYLEQINCTKSGSGRRDSNLPTGSAPSVAFSIIFKTISGNGFGQTRKTPNNCPLAAAIYLLVRNALHQLLLLAH